MRIPSPALSALARALFFFGALLRPLSAAPDTGNTLPGIDGDFHKEAEHVGRLMDNGSKAEAVAGVDALYEKTANKLSEARKRAADLSLRRTNPFVAMDARQAAAAQFDDTRQEIARLAQNYAALLQAHPDFLAQLDLPVPDGIRIEAKLYQGLRSSYAAINLAMRGDSTPAKPDVSANRISQGAFAKLLEAQIRGSGEEAVKNLQAIVAESRPKLSPTSELSAKTCADVLEFVSLLLTATHDHDAAEEILTAVTNLDSANVRVWTERAKTRMEAGEARGAIADLMIARALAPDSPEFLAANKLYTGIPKFADRIYQEPYNDGDAANAKLQQMMGGPLGSSGERAANAARRNAGRRLYACSFIDDPTRLRAAVKWVRENHKDNSEVATSAYVADTSALSKQFAAALMAKDNAAILACFDDHAALLSTEPVFWQTRIRALFNSDQPQPAAAALAVVSILKPDADWLPAFHQAISAALDKASPPPSPSESRASRRQ